MLGPLEVLDGGRPVRLTARRQRTLLAALILGSGDILSTSALTEALWGELPPASAASVLRLYVSQIRRALPAGRVVTRPPGYALVVEPGELDAGYLEELAADALGALGSGDPRLARTLFARALALWRGPALADLANEPCLRDEARRLDGLRETCLEGAIDAELALGRHRELLPELERLVAESPLREHLRAQLMLALYRAGRQVDALACYRVGQRALASELGLDPGPELRGLERRMLQQDGSLELAVDERARAANGRTRDVADTVGRQTELADLRRLLAARGTRLATLVGPGGIGKTRLALDLAGIAGDDFADGAVVVELGPLRDPAQILPAIGRALGEREPADGAWLEQLAERLRPLDLLLVLDNVEHLVAGVAPLARLLEEAPRLRMLATSRTVLRLSAEHVVAVSPLGPSAASELFIRRALAAGAGVETLEASPDEIARVCARLEGMPLAIELAAPWLRTLPPVELLALLDTGLAALERGPRDAPERHRTQRSAIDWSFNLLDPAEQRVFAGLAVFAGGFTSDSFREVGGPDATLDRLGALVDASIVQARAGRFGMLEVVREYAAERLAGDPERFRRHAEHFSGLAERAEPRLSGPDQADWLELLELEHANLGAALEWLATAGDASSELQLAATLGRFWYVRGYVAEGLARLQHAIARAAPDDDEAMLAKALRAGSALSVIQGDYPTARASAERALALYERVGDLAGSARCRSNLGAILHGQGELELAAEMLDACIRDCEGLDDVRLGALARNNRGDVALSQGDLATADERFGESLAILRELGDTANVARALYNLGAVALEQQRPEQARALLLECLALSAALNDHEDVAWCLLGLADVACSAGMPGPSALILGFTTALLERIGASMKPFERRLHERASAALERQLDPAELGSALTAGARLTLDEVIALARA